jgi:hypothetical protein
MSAYTVTNKNITEIRTLLRNYYNSFILDNDKELFSEMQNIGGTNRAGIIPSNTAEKSYSIELFQKFIHSVVDNNISNDADKGYTKSGGTSELNNGMLKIKDSNGFVLPNLKFVFVCINIINVFVDILEAYKYFIDNETDFINILKNVNKIVLVPSTHRTKAHIDATLTTTTQPNIGYHINTYSEQSKLFLAIRSFYISSGVSNTIFTPDTTVSSDILADGITGKTPQNDGLYEGTTLNFKSYFNQLAYNSAASSFNINTTEYTKTTNSYADTLENMQKNTLNNFLLFLAKMNPDNARIQVNALYFYYKYVQLYTTLIFSTMNVALNDSTSDTQYLMKLMQYTAYSTATSENIGTKPYLSNDSLFKNINADANSISTFTFGPTGPTDATAKTNAKISAANIYDKAVKYVHNGITKLIADFYTQISSNKDIDKLINTTLPMQAEYPNIAGDTIRLTYSKVPNDKKNALVNIINNTTQKQIFLDNYVIAFDGINYEIVDATTTPTILLIKGFFPNTTSENNYVNEMKPKDWNEATPTAPYIIDVKIVPKGLLALRDEYRQGKQTLISLNADIRYNTSKINSQKNMYHYEQNKDKLLTNQSYTYTIIISIIVLAILLLQIAKVEQTTRQMAGMVFGGILVIFFIVYYIINAAYIEEFKMRENFFVISNLTDLTSSSSSLDKRDYLQRQIDGINVRFIEYFQKVMNALPLTESLDFYNELNGVIRSEKNDKTNIKEILEFKKSLGYSSIDILRYESINKQIYITTLLVSALIFVILYNVSLYSSSEYINLIIFVGFIFAIIIFSYYLIFTSKTVRNRSNNKYWGPEFNKNM